MTPRVNTLSPGATTGTPSTLRRSRSCLEAPWVPCSNRSPRSVPLVPTTAALRLDHRIWPTLAINSPGQPLHMADLQGTEWPDKAPATLCPRTTSLQACSIFSIYLPYLKHPLRATCRPKQTRVFPLTYQTSPRHRGPLANSGICLSMATRRPCRRSPTLEFEQVSRRFGSSEQAC